MQNSPNRRQDSRSDTPKLEDVAARAGVSTATVSRCLNNPAVVSEATRKKVLAAVQALGYAPNFGAQALAGRRTNTFGAILPTMENAIFARGLQAFQEELQRQGITLLVASSSYDPELEEQQIHSLVARGADALLLIGHDRPERCYSFLKKRQVPYVIAWVYDDDKDRISIGFDNRKAMKALTEAVLDHGHRRLALITAERRGNDRARQRSQGVTDAMVARGLDPESLSVIETHYSIAHGARALEQLMQRTPRPTAVLCGNDVLAAGALTQARRMGLDVPGDLSITGFDDIEIAEIVTPGLTTVHVPHRNMGKGAADLLLAMRAGEDPGPSVELEAVLMLRDSLGPAPK
ncbi:LacI family DNA-binding transcriptional regulator [Marinovum sp.]|uniref:LacI family DNA-binding transcriptional regulator n=1 Tax=Marinovum sp. TaxID=2024839 RepID=UPI002B2680DA|nr:LacI family DNA-binding transcriptional regulator [Marinovum sp.]